VKKSIFRSLGAIIALACLSFAASAQTLDVKTPGTSANALAIAASPGQAKCPASVGSVFEAKIKAPACSSAFWRQPAKPRTEGMYALTNYTNTATGFGLSMQAHKAVERYAKRSG